MSYQYVEFDGVDLPLFNHSQNHSPMSSDATLRDSIGGSYDWRGATRKKGRKQTISLSGVYLGEVTYLTDGLGNYLVDESGNFIVAGHAKEMLRSQVADLMAKKGVRGQLWREDLSTDDRQWKTARLLQVNWQRKYDDHAVIANMSCAFETSMEFWHAEEATETSVNAVAATPKALNITNNGQQVDDAVITITHTSGTITAIAFLDHATGVDWTWTGSLSGGTILTIDCGAQTIRKGSTDSYSGFALGGSHTAAGWLPLSSGENAFGVTLTGGNATVTVSHYDQYA